MRISTRTFSLICGTSIALSIAGAMLSSGTLYGAVTAIFGGSVNQPLDIIPLCSNGPQTCPDFWDLRPTEGSSVVYGSRALGASDNSCLKSTNGARTFSLCPTNYPVTGIARETDIPADGSILSLRFEGNVGRCTLDRSTDGGVVWSPINIVVGANLQCPTPNVNFVGEVMRCSGSACIAYVQQTGTPRLDLYRSLDNGQTWALVSTGGAISNCAVAQGIFFDGTIGIAGCHRNITGDATAARVSVDGGATWSYITPPANLDYCGTPSQISGFGTGFGFVCLNTTLTSFRLMDSTGVALTPSSQSVPVGTFSPFANPATVQLNSNNIFMFMATTAPVCCATIHSFKIYNGGQDIVETAASIAGEFPVGRFIQARNYQGSLLATFTSATPHFALLKGS